MARKLVVEIVGDASSLEKSYATATRSTKAFDREISHATRGALAGSGIFHTFGRSLAFASGGFLAFESASVFLRDSIDAAREAAVSQRSLAAQMKASGESFDANRERIEKVALSYGKFGFQNDEVIASLTVLERGTGNINKALSLQGLTADLARAKNIDLAAAAGTVAKVFGGQETALRRAVPGLHKNAHGWDLIRLAQAKLAGQAAANTTAAERFQATLHDTEEIIGTALLPTMNRYLDSLSKWMANTQNQAKIQKIANETAKTGADVFGALARAVGLAADAYGKYQGLVSKLPGGKGGALRNFFGGTVFDQIRDEAKRARQIRDYFSGFARGDFAQGAGKISGGGGDFPAPPGGGRPGTLIPVGARPRSLQGRFNLAELRLAQAQLTAGLADDRRILVVEKAITEQQAKQAKTLKDRTALTQRLVGIVGQIRAIDQQAGRQQRNTWFDALIGRQLDRVQDLSGLRHQLARLREIAGEVRARMADTKDVTRRLTLQDKLVEILRQERDLQGQITGAVKAGNQALRDRADAIKSATLAALDERHQAVQNRQQLQDALAALRTARALGGPQGIKLAKRDVSEARFTITRAQLEGATARLTRGPGGTQRFALGNTIQITINGATDPEKVAQKVAEIIKRQSRHTSAQSRGPAAGAGY